MSHKEPAVPNGNHPPLPEPRSSYDCFHLLVRPLIFSFAAPESPTDNRKSIGTEHDHWTSYSVPTTKIRHTVENRTPIP